MSAGLSSIIKVKLLELLPANALTKSARSADALCASLIGLHEAPRALSGPSIRRIPAKIPS